MEVKERNEDSDKLSEKGSPFSVHTEYDTNTFYSLKFDHIFAV